MDLRRAFDQVRILDRNGYGQNGEWVGLDVKVMRTQRREDSFAHLRNSLATFQQLLEKVRTLDEEAVAQLQAARDYEALDQLILRHLLGV